MPTTQRHPEPRADNDAYLDRVRGVRRPRLKPPLRCFRRDARTLQIGLHPHRAVVLHDVEPAVMRVLDRLDGTHTLRQVIEAAWAEGLDEEQTLTLLGTLIRRGVLEDAAASPTPLRSLPLRERDRLRPDLEALSLAPATIDCGYGALARRRAAYVRVYGAGRVGAQIAVLLAAAGVGDLCVIDASTATAADVVPGGLGWPEVGGSRQDGAVAAARRVAPGVNAWTGERASHPGDRARRPDLVVLAPVGRLDDTLPATLVEAGVPHLAVAAFEGHGSVGPLVLPGRTACLHCVALTRRDRDPSRPVAGACAGGLPAGETACDTVLAARVAAAAAGYALAHLDGLEHPATNGTLDFSPYWGWMTHSWSIHPECGCGKNSLS